MDCTITVCCPICGKECTYKVSEWVRDHCKVVSVNCPCLEPPVVETKTHVVIIPHILSEEKYKVLRKYPKGETHNGREQKLSDLQELLSL